jgi:hypothetical protein
MKQIKTLVSPRGVAEEAPGAYKDVSAVVDSADHAGLACKVARLEPIVHQGLKTRSTAANHMIRTGCNCGRATHCLFP